MCNAFSGIKKKEWINMTYGKCYMDPLGDRERERERVSTNFRLTHGRLHFYMLLGLYEHIEMISGNGSGVSISQEHKEAVGLECVKLREIWG